MGLLDALKDQQFRSDVGTGLLSLLQGASNSAASTVSGPVDLMAAGLRKVGMNVPQNALLGSEWMKQKGLTQTPQNEYAGIAGESLGNILPIVAQAKAPQIANGLLSMAQNAMTPAAPFMAERGAVVVGPRSEALETARKNGVTMLGLPENNTALDRANAMPEFAKPLWQGFRGDGKEGNWYTNSVAEGVRRGYLENRPISAEFRGPSVGLVAEDPSITFGPQFTQDVVDILGGDLGKKFLKDVGGPGSQLSHFDMIYALKSRLGSGGLGEQAALDVYNKSKARTKGFSGADLTLLHPTTPVRYATAAFDPARRSELDRMAGVLPLGLLSIPDRESSGQRK